jgi:hypothetical protein
MELHQSISYLAVKTRTKTEAQKFGEKIKSGELSLENAHLLLINPDVQKLNLFQIAGLAQAIACFQCSE